MDSIIYTTKPDISKLPGGLELAIDLPIIGGPWSGRINLNRGINYLPGFLTEKSCDAIVNLMSAFDVAAPVSIQGMQEVTPETTGSVRTTCWAPGSAELIWDLVKYDLEIIKPDYTTSTDWWQKEHLDEKDAPKGNVAWVPCGVSPMLRYMKYQKGGQHYAHYDASFIYPGGEYRTLKSFVLYLTTNKSGATRFIADGQGDMPVWRRNHADWTRPTCPTEIRDMFLPIKGNLLLFDHRICHDVEPYDGAEGDRIIIRGDIIYKKL
jgi:hypothetical protein